MDRPRRREVAQRRQDVEHRRQGYDRTWSIRTPTSFGEEGLVDFAVRSEGGMRLSRVAAADGGADSAGPHEMVGHLCAMLPRRSRARQKSLQNTDEDPQNR